MIRSLAPLALAAVLATGQIQAGTVDSPHLAEAPSQGATPEWTGERGITPGSGIAGGSTPVSEGSATTPSDL